MADFNNRTSPQVYRGLFAAAITPVVGCTVLANPSFAV